MSEFVALDSAEKGEEMRVVRSLARDSMYTREEIEALLVLRLFRRIDNCNAHYGNHVDGQIRALCAVLTGERPPVFENAEQILSTVGIPFTMHGEFFEIDPAWMKSHGFNADDTHPNLADW